MLRNQDDVRTACNAGIQRQPAGLVAHDLNAHYAAVAARSGVDAVNNVSGNVHSGMETESNIGAKNIIVDRFGQADDVQTLLAEQVCRFVGAVAAQAEQAVQLGVLVGLFHGGNLVHLVIAHNAHHLERGALGAKNRAAYRQNAGKLIRRHDAVVAVDQAVITVQNANDLHLVAHALIQRFGHAADGCVQAGAVTAGCQNTNTHLHRNLPVRSVPLAARVPRCCTMPGNVHTICIFYLLQYATQAVLSMRCGGGAGGKFL